MADSILRLKVESQEYDQKIKRAAEGIQQYAQKCRDAGGTLEHLDDGVEDFVKALGRMDTVSKSAKGSINEMTRAFADLSVQYNRLTEEEKNSPFGKALKSSLDQLKGRIQEGNNELRNIGSTINTTGGFMDQLAQKFTINIDALKLFNAGMTAAKAALDVAKDAFFASEANVDEWGRTMQSAQGLYEGFLNALNTGDISGYLSRMNDIVVAARQAYNELDKLGTMKTIQAPGISKQQTENERIRMMIQTGRYIAPIDGRKNAVWNGKTMQSGQLLDPEQIRILERQLQGGLQNITKLVGNEVRQTGKSIDAYYNSLAKQNGMSLKEFRQGTSSWDAYSKKMEGYQKYEQWRDKAAKDWYASGARVSRDFDKGNPYLEFKKWGVFRVDKQGENSLNDLVNLIKQRDQQTSQIYSTLSQSYRAINRAEGITVKKLLGGGGGGGKGGKSVATNQGEIMNLGGISALGDTSLLTQGAGIVLPVSLDIQSPEEKLRDEIKRLQDLLKNAFTDAEREAIGAALDEKEGALSDMLSRGKKKGNSTTDSLEKFNGDFSKVVGGVGNIVSGIQSMGIEIPEGIQSVLGVLTGISSIMSGITAILTLIQIDTKATAIASATDAIIPLARGGVARAASGFMVPGNNYSGDLVPAYLNSGEMVLNKFQQQALAGTLENGGMKNISISGSLRGEDIVLSADRFGRRSGKGELAFWK